MHELVEYAWKLERLWHDPDAPVQSRINARLALREIYSGATVCVGEVLHAAS